MSSNHQHKRQYAGTQPSITSYFPAVSPTSQPNYSITPQSSYHESHSRAPTLPATVQANLLSVGMRVRKSVPEGYKNQSAFAVYSDSAPATPMEQQRAEARHGTSGNVPIMKSNRPRARELTPWCGIHKIGGMAPQIQSPGDQSADDWMDDDYVPSMSQGSTVSTNSTNSVSPSGERKRRMDFDEEDNEDATFAFDFSPRTLGSAFIGDRVIAVPRKSKHVKTNVTIFGQENMNTDPDFEDADFLDYSLIGEVEMGGV